jgi:hypothetical protein
MATKAQMEANRRNARKSTGPKTPSGKGLASKNSMRHGLTAKQIVLWPTDDPNSWAERREKVISYYNPRNVLEEILVNRIVKALVDSSHAEKLEAAIVSDGTISQLAGRALITAKATEHGATDNLDEMNAALDELEPPNREGEPSQGKHEDKQRATSPPRLPRRTVENFVENLDSLGLVNRYQLRSDSQLYRAMHELERLHAARRGQELIPPAIVHIDLNDPSTASEAQPECETKPIYPVAPPAVEDIDLQINQEGAPNPELQKKLLSPEPPSATVVPDATLVEAKKGQFSFFITNSQKAQLRERGYSDDEIAKMIPEKAHEILGLACKDRLEDSVVPLPK